jgi:hypothetical protein
MKKVSDKYLLNLLREIVSRRAGGHCEWPGCNETNCDPHHVFSKEHKSIRYDADACVNLCCGHHTANTLSAHKSPEYFLHIIIYERVRDVRWLAEITKRKNMIVKFNDHFRVLWKEKLLNELRGVAA